jgi:hypothetical protein
MCGNNNARFFHHRWLQPNPDFVVSYKPVLVPALLATSKAINAEAAPMFWGQPFYISDLVAMHTFLHRITPASLALMREVTIISWPRTQKHLSMAIFNLLRAATNLEHLTVYDQIIKQLPYRIPSNTNGDSDRAKHVAKKLYRDIYPWLEAMVQTRGIEHLEKVLKLHEDNFQPDYNHYVLHNPIASNQNRINDWTEERRKACEHTLFEEIKRIMEFDH